MSNLIGLVLPISVTFWKIIWGYFLFKSSLSFILASSAISVSGMELTEDLVSGCSYKLVFCSILGSNLEVSHWSLLQLISWTSLHFPTGCKHVINVFLLILHGTFLALRTGMLRYSEVLWSTMCRISSRMMPSGSWNISAFNSYELVLSAILGALTSMMDTDMASSVTLTFILIMG